MCRHTGEPSLAQESAPQWCKGQKAQGAGLPVSPRWWVHAWKKNQMIVRRGFSLFAVDFLSLRLCPFPLFWKRGGLNLQVNKTGRAGKSGAKLRSNYGFSCPRLFYQVGLEVQRLALKNLRGEAIPTDGGQEMLVCP